MSWNPALEPGCPDDVGFDAIETLIVPRPATSAGSRFGAPCRRRSGRWSGRSSSSTRPGRPSC
jgi:hypothetical protein